jgi:sugar lactone lactonase YvrE
MKTKVHPPLMLLRLAPAAALAVTVLLPARPLAAQNPWTQVREAYEAAQAAHKQKDWPLFLEKSQALRALAPRSSRALYTLAQALARNGKSEDAAAALHRIADWGASYDLSADADLQSLGGRADFEAVRQRMKDLHRPMGDAAAAFTLGPADFIPEGVVHDPKSGDFFVSSVHRRKVVRVAPGGEAKDFVTERQDGLFAATGLAVCPAARALFVATKAEPQMLGHEPPDDRSFVFEYDLDRGTLRRKLAPPVPDGTLSDLACAPDGALYASDPAAGRVSVLRPGAASFDTAVAPGRLVSAQGLAPSPDGRFLFVADYALGVFRLDLANGDLLAMPAPEDLLLTGIDGLVMAGDSLVAIQNGFEPHRVVRLRLAPDRASITSADVLARAHPEFDEPTLGAVAGSDFYFVANSQYRFFGEDGTLKRDGLRPPVILRIRLPWVG